MVIKFLNDIYGYGVDNFTFLHLYSLIVSVFAVFMAVLFVHIAKRKDPVTTDETDIKEDDDDTNGLQAKYKMAKQKLLEKQLMIDPTKRLEEEKRSEQQTLQTVMQLLQQQSGSENTLTMDELQKQLALYRAQMK